MIKQVNGYFACLRDSVSRQAKYILFQHLDAIHDLLTMDRGAHRQRGRGGAERGTREETVGKLLELNWVFCPAFHEE